MTRINLVPPSELCDQHLLAEYRELPRVVNAILEIIKSGMPFTKVIKIPDEFKFGQGHVKFFYKRGNFLIDRFDELFQEMQMRNYEPVFTGWTPEQEREICRRSEDWEPSPKDIALSRLRIGKRLATMKQTPRYYGEKLEDV